MDGKVYPDQGSADRAARNALIQCDIDPRPGENFEVEQADAGWWWFCTLPDYPGSRAKAFMGDAALQALEELYDSGLLDSTNDGLQRAVARVKAKRVLRASGKLDRAELTEDERKVRTAAMSPTERRRAFFTDQVQQQRRWIAEHGGNVHGYIKRYGDQGLEMCYGDGGTKIFLADMGALREYELAAGFAPTPITATVTDSMEAYKTLNGS